MHSDIQHRDGIHITYTKPVESRIKPPTPARTKSAMNLPPPPSPSLVASSRLITLQISPPKYSLKSHRSMPSFPSLPSPSPRAPITPYSPTSVINQSISSISSSSLSPSSSPRKQSLQTNLPSPKQPKYRSQMIHIQKPSKINISMVNEQNESDLQQNNNLNGNHSTFRFYDLPQITESTTPRPRHRNISSPSSRSTRSSRSLSNASSRSSRSSRSCTSSPRHHIRKRANHRKDLRNIECICGRKMGLTQNPRNRYPPNAVLYCQQSAQCKKKLIIEKDYFYACKKRTNYHDTKDGKYIICYSCSISLAYKQERIRKNHQLLIKQMKNNNDVGQVIMTKDTKNYILSSSSANSKDETIRLLKEKYIDCNKKRSRTNVLDKNDLNKNDMNKNDNNNKNDGEQDVMVHNKVKYKILKQGFMMKKGNIWNKSFKKRYFKLCENKQLFYFKNYFDSQQRGIADLNETTSIIKKGNMGFEVITPSREWKFLCTSSNDRDEWYSILNKLLF